MSSANSLYATEMRRNAILQTDVCSHFLHRGKHCSLRKVLQVPVRHAQLVDCQFERQLSEKRTSALLTCALNSGQLSCGLSLLAVAHTIIVHNFWKVPWHKVNPTFKYLCCIVSLYFRINLQSCAGGVDCEPPDVVRNVLPSVCGRDWGEVTRVGGWGLGLVWSPSALLGKPEPNDTAFCLSQVSVIHCINA